VFCGSLLLTIPFSSKLALIRAAFAVSVVRGASRERLTQGARTNSALYMALGGERAVVLSR
jgi:hypothetical protein